MEIRNELNLDSSVIELSRAALEQNIEFLRQRAGRHVTLSSVIKGNAYGHGVDTFLPMAEEAGIDHFSVFCAREAWVARSVSGNPNTRIMIMGEVSDDALEWVIENEISFYLFEQERMKRAAEAARKVGKPARVHLQIETGMHRIGLEERELSDVLEFIKKRPKEIDVIGICTHLAGAESVANYVRIQRQKERFREAVDLIQKRLGEIRYIHAASSAGLLAYPDTIYNMVRVGIAMYGFWPSREIYMLLKREQRQEGRDPLTRLIRWKSRIMSVKDVDEGEFVGYGNMHMTNREEQIATVPIGYSHGFSRTLSNSGFVLVRGERARVVGLVNMNMLTIDVTDIEGVRRGDEVVLIGDQEGQEITLSSFGELTNNLNYEVLIRLPERLPRRVV